MHKSTVIILQQYIFIYNIQVNYSTIKVKISHDINTPHSSHTSLVECLPRAPTDDLEYIFQPLMDILEQCQSRPSVPPTDKCYI